MLGEDHKIVKNTQESINFVAKSQEEQVCLFVCAILCTHQQILPINVSVYIFHCNITVFINSSSAQAEQLRGMEFIVSQASCRMLAMRKANGFTVKCNVILLPQWMLCHLRDVSSQLALTLTSQYHPNPENMLSSSFRFKCILNFILSIRYVSSLEFVR